MHVVYFKKAKSRVVRVVEGDSVEVEIPGYEERFLVELSDPASVGPLPLTTVIASEGSAGHLYLSATYLSANRIAGDRDGIKYPDNQGGSFAGFWRYLSSPARTPAIADAIAQVRARVEGAGAESQQDHEALVLSLRHDRELKRRLGDAFPHPEAGRQRHLDQLVLSLVLGVACGALR